MNIEASLLHVPYQICYFEDIKSLYISLHVKFDGFDAEEGAGGYYMHMWSQLGRVLTFDDFCYIDCKMYYIC